MEWVFDDGGRQAAGFKGSAGDCVARSVAIATGLSYAEVYAALSDGNANERQTHSKTSGRRTARSGIRTKRKWFKDYMTALDWKWTPTMAIGSGCKVHLNADELPPGRLIVAVSKHYTAVIDGVIHDTHDPSERGTTVYPKSTPPDLLPANVRWNGSGWVYAPERCVYGYWSKAA